jgi:hypothetical protein
MGSLSKLIAGRANGGCVIGGGTGSTGWGNREKAFSQLSIEVVSTRRAIRQPFSSLKESVF